MRVSMLARVTPRGHNELDLEHSETLPGLDGFCLISSGLPRMYLNRFASVRLISFRVQIELYQTGTSDGQLSMHPFYDSRALIFRSTFVFTER